MFAVVTAAAAPLRPWAYHVRSTSCLLFCNIVTPSAWVQLWLLNPHLADAPHQIAQQQVNPSIHHEPVQCKSHARMQPLRWGIEHTFQANDTLAGVAALYALPPRSTCDSVVSKIPIAYTAWGWNSCFNGTATCTRNSRLLFLVIRDALMYFQTAFA
jgi:hypothetical protein